VVKNEKRQRVDNQPYGQRFHLVSKHLYPKGHPYSWTVIGSLADLQAATLDDVKNFYAKWYVPNNVTLTLAGDFDVANAKQLIEKYFGEIPRGSDIAAQTVQPVALEKTKSIYHEDNFATVPQLTYVWPTVDQFHPDAPALTILSELLSVGKRAPLNQVLIDEAKLTSEVSTFSYGKEIAGEFYLVVSANAGTDLDSLSPAIEKGFQRFEKSGILSTDLDRIKAQKEVEFFNSIQSTLGKAIALAEYNTLADDPNLVNTDIEKLRAVSIDDVKRVYQTYLQAKPHLAISFVPKGQKELILGGAIKAEIFEEKIVNNAEASTKFDPSARTFEPTISKFNRSIEPDFGAPYQLSVPEVWRAEQGNGVQMFGIENSETPLVFFELQTDAGRYRADLNKPAVPSLTADMLQTGTVNKTNAQLQDAIQSLGSSVSISTDKFHTTIRGQSLARNLNQTIALVEEMLLEPRWDKEEFALLKRRQLNNIDKNAALPNMISAREMAKIEYPEEHIFSYQPYGTKEKLEAVTLADLKSFYKTNYSPKNAVLRIVGDVDQAMVKGAFAGLSKRWNTKAPASVATAQALEVKESKLYFYDVPGAKQSYLRIARPSLTAVDEEFPLAEAVNYLLGDVYTSKLNTELRINNGYTYGIRSGFSGAKDRGTFSITSSVRSNVTFESLQMIRKIVSEYGPNFTEKELVVLKDALLRSLALKSETLGAKLAVLSDISKFDYSNNYAAENAARIKAMSLEEFKALAEEYLRSNSMNYLVVGDAETQLARLKELGMGDAILLNPTQQ